MKKTSILISLLMVLLLVSGCTDMLAGLTGQTGTLTGTVVDDVSTNGISGAIVEIENSSKTQITNSTGTFIFDNLAAGSYNLKVTKDGYEVYTASYQILAGDTNTVSIRLTPVADEDTRGAIKGLVVEEGTNEPVVEARVKIDGQDIEKWTDINGEFVLNNLIYDTYALIITKDGYEDRIKHVEVNAAEVTPRIELAEVQRFYGIIEGSVVYQNTTEPIDQVTVRIDDTDLLVQTNLFGEFNFGELEYGVYTLVISKDGFEKHIQEIKLDQEKVNVLIELREKENVAKSMVGNFKNSMYQLGSVYFQEESVVQDNIMNDVMPFFEELSPNFEEMGRGLYHIEVIDKMEVPGEYECTWYEDEYGEYPVYTLIEPGDPLADEWVWKVHDNGSLITIILPNMDEHVIEYDDYNQVDIDFTGSILEYNILSATNAEYRVLLAVGSADTRNLTFTHTEFDEYNGTTETYVINAVVPFGPTAELDVTFDTDHNDEYQEIRVSGSMNLDTFREDMIFSIYGSVNTPVIEFYGELETHIFGAGNITEINELEGYSFNVWACGEVITDEFVVDGKIYIEVDYVEAIDYMGVYYSRPVPYKAEMDLTYTSNETIFTGFINIDFLNYETFFASTESSKFEDIQIYLAGDLTHGDQIAYGVELFFTRPENHEVQANINLWTSEFGLWGELAYDDENGFTYIDLYDNNETHFTAEVPNRVDDGHEVGSIIGADNVIYGTVAYSEELGASFFIQYTDGEWEMLPLNPTAYLPNDTIE